MRDVSFGGTLMNCSDIRPLLSDYHDGEITPEQQRQVERHLAGCADCARVLAEYRAISSDFRAMAVPAVPSGLRRDVWRRIEALDSGASVPAPRPVKDNITV